MPLPRTWKALEKRGFFKERSFQNGYGRVLEHSFASKTVYVTLVCFTIYDTKHNSLKNYEMYHRKWCFFIFMGFRNANENVFHGLVIWSLGFGKLWKYF